MFEINLLNKTGIQSKIKQEKKQVKNPVNNESNIQSFDSSNL